LIFQVWRRKKNSYFPDGRIAPFLLPEKPPFSIHSRNVPLAPALIHRDPPLLHPNEARHHSTISTLQNPFHFHPSPLHSHPHPLRYLSSPTLHRLSSPVYRIQFAVIQVTTIRNVLKNSESSVSSELDALRGYLTRLRQRLCSLRTPTLPLPVLASPDSEMLDLKLVSCLLCLDAQWMFSRNLQFTARRLLWCLCAYRRDSLEDIHPSFVWRSTEDG
jgi:hypothetical protein